MRRGRFRKVFTGLIVLIFIQSTLFPFMAMAQIVPAMTSGAMATIIPQPALRPTIVAAAEGLRAGGTSFCFPVTGLRKQNSANMEASKDTTTWNYQEATGLLIAKLDAAGRGPTYTYTTGGKLLTRAWARNSGTLTTTYSYDANTAELLNINYSDTTPDVMVTYDRLGRAITINDAVGSRTFGYNNALQLETETINGIYTKVLTWTYATSGVVGRITGFNVGSDYGVSYGYDPAGRLNSVGWNVTGAVAGNATYTYVSTSNLLATLDMGNQTTTYTYEANRDLRTSVQNRYNASLISQYDYTHDAIGRRASAANSGSAFSAAAFNRYNYNNRHELATSARYLGTDINNLTTPVQGEYRAFIYDPIGNRTGITSGTNNGTYTTNNVNQYASADLPAGGTNTYTHDADGNLTDITGVKNVHYTYDALNHLVSAAPVTPVVNDKKVDLTYDYAGRRVQKIVSNWNGSLWVQQTVKRFVYVGWNVIEEQTVSQPSQYYVWGMDVSQSTDGAGGVGGLLAKIESGVTRNYLYDGNSNVAQLINAATGTVDAHYEYDPYGNIITSAGSQAATNPFRFSSKYFDLESGLYYYGYRYYNPELGRWINRDPIGEKGGLNLYSAAGNDLIDLIDVLGLTEMIHGTQTELAPNIIGEGLRPQSGGWPNIWMSTKDTVIPNKPVYLHYDMDVSSASEVPCQVIEEALERGKNAVRAGSGMGRPIWGHINDWIQKQGHGIWKVPVDKGGRLVLPDDSDMKGYTYAFRSAEVWKNAKPVLIEITGPGRTIAIQALKNMYGEIRIAGKIGTAIHVGGRVLFLSAVAMDSYTVFTATNKIRAGARVAGSWIGALRGTAIGGGIGTWLPTVVGNSGPQVVIPEEIVTVPLGKIIGEAVGGWLGYFIGGVIGEKTYDWVFEPGFSY